MNLRERKNVEKMRRKEEKDEEWGFKLRNVLKKRMKCMGKGMKKVKWKEWMDVKSIERKEVRIIEEEEMEIVIDMKIGEGMGKERGDGKRKEKEDEEIEGDVRRKIEDIEDWRERKLRRKEDGSWEEIGKKIGSGWIIEIEERDESVRIEGKKKKRGKIVWLEGKSGIIDCMEKMFWIEIKNEKGKREEDKSIERMLKEINERLNIGIEEMKKFGKEDLEKGEVD